MLNYYNTRSTVELGELVKSGFEIFNFDFPYHEIRIPYTDINGQEHNLDLTRDGFEKRFIERFYFRQIGQETPVRFRHYLKAKLNDVMPYYVQMQKSVSLMLDIADPFESYNLTETFERTASQNETKTGTSSDTTTSEKTGSANNSTQSENIKKFSDTPQGEIENIESYLSEATVDSGNNSDTSEAHENGEVESLRNSSDTSESGENESYTLTRVGNIGVATLGEEMRKFRESFINIDNIIFEELECLFLGIY